MHSARSGNFSFAAMFSMFFLFHALFFAGVSVIDCSRAFFAQTNIFFVAAPEEYISAAGDFSGDTDHTNTIKLVESLVRQDALQNFRVRYVNPFILFTLTQSLFKSSPPAFDPVVEASGWNARIGAELAALPKADMVALK